MSVIVFFLISALAADQGILLSEARSRTDEAVRLAQEMVDHGREGHTGEIVERGRLMMEQTVEALAALKKISAGRPAFREVTRRLTLAKSAAQEAIRFGKEDRIGLALGAARRALSEARRARMFLARTE